MHIVECYLESAGFDYKLLRGGIAVYIWNLATQFVAAGHRVSIVTAANGNMEYLRQHYAVELLAYEDDYELPLVLDPDIWRESEVTLHLKTRAHRITLQGIDVYLLENAMLDMFPDTVYPPYELKGRDLGFYKPLVFQVDCVRFIRARFREPSLIHAHEPYYQFLLPPAFKDDPDKIVISTVQSNMPINKKVFKPKVARLLRLLGVELDLDRFDDRTSPEDGLLECMRQVLPNTHLYYDYADNYVNLFALVLEYSDYVDFLSPGQMRFYSSFIATPFEQMFQQLTISRVVEHNAHKFFVGWCAISDDWHAFDGSATDRGEVLRELGLDPGLPTFYHNARYALEHKGQMELMRAVDRFLSSGGRANFIVRCISGKGIANPYFHEVQARHRNHVHLDGANVAEGLLMRYAAAADFCMFPSKFEMDTFLIAQGESMLCGAVPIGTAQEGTSHFNHALPLSDCRATGFSVPRSFVSNDELLVEGLATQIARAVEMYLHDKAAYTRLAANARSVASAFTWRMAARAHLDVFEVAMARLQTDESDHPAAPAKYGSVDYSVAPRRREPAQLAEDSVNVRFADGVSIIEYPLSGLSSIDLFARCDPARKRFSRVPMERRPSCFRAELPVSPGAAEMYFCLTATDGSVRWERSSHATH